MSSKPSWLKNAKLAKEAPKTSPKKTLNKKKVAKVLEENKLTIVVDDEDTSQIVDVFGDPEEDWDEMKSWSEGRMLSVTAKTMRDAFVCEYLKDFSGVEAASRIGSTNPVNTWRRLIKCPYVQRAIGKKMQDWEANSVVTRNKVCAVLWRESNDFVHGTAATRVAAASKLAKLMGFEVDNINLNVNDNRTYIDKPLTKQEFLEMREGFDKEF